MSCYIIPIGGTGERVMRAVMHLAAAGVFNNAPQNSRTIKMLGIDPDSTSFAKTMLLDTISDYEALARENVFRTKVEKTMVQKEEVVMWTPMDQLNTSLQADVGTLTSENELFEFLYSKRERNLNLKGGFYSHTSIGSYYILNGIVDNDGHFVEPWKTFFSNIRPYDKIIIICSMFGGTGASGVPTIARELRRHNITGEDTSAATITGIFLEPYFTSETADTVNTSAFPTKSKIAFEYYDQQNFGKDIFDSMYFLGESEEMMKVKHCESGAMQRNKANIIELYAATAVMNEMITPRKHIQGACDVLLTYRGTDKADGDFAKNSLRITDSNGKTTHIFKRLAYFMAFSVMYTKVIYPLVQEHDKGLFGYRAKFLNKYNLTEKVDGNEVPSRSADSLKAYCEKYMEWMREIITESKGNVDFEPSHLDDPKSEAYKYTKWFKRDSYFYDSVARNADTHTDVAIIPGFEKLIISGRKDENELPSSASIYDALCETSGKGHNIAELVSDILDLIRTLEKK